MSPRSTLLILSITLCTLGALAAPSISGEPKEKLEELVISEIREPEKISDIQLPQTEKELLLEIISSTEDTSFEQPNKQQASFQDVFEENEAFGALKKVQIVATDEDSEVVEALKEPPSVDQLKIDQGVGEPRVYYRGAQLWRIAFHDQKSKNAVAILHSTYSNGKALTLYT